MKSLAALALVLGLTSFNFNANNTSNILPEKNKTSVKETKKIVKKISWEDYLSEKTYLENREKKLLSEEYFSQTKKNIDSKDIPVLMFHKIGPVSKRYEMTSSEFRFILDVLHNHEYYALNLEQFVSGNFSKVPVGKKPFLITFDDATEGQFDYIKGTDIINPDCAVGIMDEYFSKYKDFGRGAVFYINYFGVDKEYIVPFRDDKTIKEKMTYLLNDGFDIGAHTPYHTNNRHSTEKAVKEQMMIMDALLQYHTEQNMNTKIKTYAHPYGAIPINPLVENDIENHYVCVMDAVGGLSKHPLNVTFNPESVPRIESDLKNLNYFFNKKNQYVVTEKDHEFYETLFNDVPLKVVPRPLELLPDIVAKKVAIDIYSKQNIFK